MKKRIGLGTWSWGNKLFWNYQSTNDDDLCETYNEALLRGFDLIDTCAGLGYTSFLSANGNEQFFIFISLTLENNFSMSREIVF